MKIKKQQKQPIGIDANKLNSILLMGGFGFLLGMISTAAFLFYVIYVILATMLTIAIESAERRSNNRK